MMQHIRKLQTIAMCLLTVGWILTGWAQSDLTPQERAQKVISEALDTFWQGDEQRAESLLLQATHIDDKADEAHFWLGRLYAQRAASSPEARQKAVTYFRRALQLQPYGESGELYRAWIAHLNGRPKTILLGYASHPELRHFDAYTTRAVAKLLPNAARKSHFSLAPPREGSYYPIQQIDKSAIHTLSLDASGNVRYGWMVFFTVTQFEVKRDETNDGKKNFGSYALGRARVWLIDPLAEQVYRPMDVGASTYLTARLLKTVSKKYYVNYSDALQSGVEGLADNIWEKVSAVAAAAPDNALFDEIMAPTLMPEIFARSTLNRQEARQRPLVALVSSPPPDNAATFSIKGFDNQGTEKDTAILADKAQSASEKVSRELRKSLLTDLRCAVVAPSDFQEALDLCGYKMDTQNLKEWAAAGKRLGAARVLMVRLDELNAEMKQDVLGLQTRVSVGVKITVRLIDTATMQIRHEKSHSATESKTRVLAGDLSHLLPPMENKAIQSVVEAATKDLRAQAMAAE